MGNELHELQSTATNFYVLLKSPDKGWSIMKYMYVCVY